MDIQLEKKKGIQKKHIPYIAGGARHPPPEQLEPRPADIERRIGTRRKTKPFA